LVFKDSNLLLSSLFNATPRGRNRLELLVTLTTVRNFKCIYTPTPVKPNDTPLAELGELTLM